MTYSGGIHNTEPEKKNRAIYFLSCAVVVIVLATCVATVVTAIYFSDNSPWKNDPETTSPRECAGKDGNQSGKVGDVVRTKTKLGNIEGKLMNTSLGTMVERYLGIPYAEPPIGGNRFKAPKPYSQSYTSGVYKAFEFGSSCIQVPSDISIPSIWKVGQDLSEDCLYLNVWVPHPRREKRPVMVWIHGGSNIFGSASLPGYDGAVLSSYGDVMVVSVNYRLGALGFLSLEIPEESPGNQGLKDQQMALRWVQENIEQFGGDPKQVTIFGESAGATSVGWHLLVQSSENLFDRAILQSGAPNAAWAHNSLQDAEHYAAELGKKFDCSSTPSLVECLQEVPVMELYITGLQIPRISITYAVWAPVIDGEFVTDDPDVLLESGRVNQKDVMNGVNKDEGTFFIRNDNYNATYWSYVQEVINSLDPLQPDVIPGFYKPKNESNPADLFASSAELLADWGFVCPANRFSREGALQGSKVYYYYLTYRSAVSIFPETWGVPHSADLQWVFGHPFMSPEFLPYSKEEQFFSKSVMSMWTNFAKYGNPDVQDEFEWKTSSVKIPSYMELRGPYDFVYHQNITVHQERCALWF